MTVGAVRLHLGSRGGEDSVCQLFAAVPGVRAGRQTQTAGVVVGPARLTMEAAS